MPQPEIVVKPREVMPEGARTLPAEYYVDAAYFRREMEARVAELRQQDRVGRAANPQGRLAGARSAHRAHGMPQSLQFTRPESVWWTGV